MTKISDLFPNIEFIAYRWVSAEKANKTELYNFKEKLENIKYDWKFANNPIDFIENRKSSKEIEKPLLEYEEICEYIELLGIDGTLYYVFSDEKTFYKYIDLITGSDYETCFRRLKIKDYCTSKRDKHVRYFKEQKKLDLSYLLELKSLAIYIHKKFPVIYFFNERVISYDKLDVLYMKFNDDLKLTDELQALQYLKSHIKSNNDIHSIKNLCKKLNSDSQPFSLLGEQLYTLKSNYLKAVEIAQEEFSKKAQQELQDKIKEAQQEQLDKVKKVQQEQLDKVKKVQQEQLDKIKEAGDTGEKEVKYALKWLDKVYMVLDEGNAIRIRNEKYIDEVQEIDHIIIGPQGVFILETKNYKGRIMIDEQGNWLREVNGEKKVEKNPIQQIRRHEKLIKSILPENVNLISIICLAHPTSIIENIQMSAVPVVRVDLLSEYIENLKCEQQLSNQEIKQYAQLLMKYKL